MRDPEPRLGGALSCAAFDVRVPPLSLVPTRTSLLIWAAGQCPL